MWAKEIMSVYPEITETSTVLKRHFVRKKGFSGVVNFIVSKTEM
jgi:hypothetical protein